MNSSTIKVNCVRLAEGDTLFDTRNAVRNACACSLMKDFVLKLILKVVDCFTEVVDLAVFIACSTNVFDSVTEVEVQSLVSDEVPRLNGSSSVVVGA